jgi:hypothetical protein
MDINYFIFLKKTYEDALKNIEYIINDTRNNNNDNDDTFYMNRKKHFLELIDICNINIYSLCEHEFEEDLIDIDPDTSHKITYCKFCEFTKK